MPIVKRIVARIAILRGGVLWDPMFATGRCNEALFATAF
jgi:hypothetical protein